MSEGGRILTMTPFSMLAGQTEISSRMEELRRQIRDEKVPAHLIRLAEELRKVLQRRDRQGR